MPPHSAYSRLAASLLTVLATAACTSSRSRQSADFGGNGTSHVDAREANGGPSAYPPAPTHYRASTLPFRHSMVALAPEWEPNDFSVMKPLGAQIVAWGNDPVFQGMTSGPWQRAQRGYEALGIDRVAMNVFALSASAKELATHPELQNATVVDIAGDKLVPPWLTEEHQGVPSYWGCTNHPIFQAHLERRMALCAEPAGQLLHIDDHLGTAGSLQHGGCFCDHCMNGFRDWLRDDAAADELSALGLDAESFDYRAFLTERGLSSRAAVKAAVEGGALPLGEQFWTYQRDAARGFVHHLRQRASEIWGRDVALGVNAWNTEPRALFDAHLVDYYANELTHIGVEDTQAPFSYLLGTALGRPLFATASGEDWVRVKQEGYVERVQGWIAQSYAFGHAFMYAHRKWAFSKETGTLWYDTPLGTYTPVTDFIHEHAALFDGAEALASVAVLYDAAAEAAGSTGARRIVAELHEAQVPVGLVVAGSDTLLRRLTANDVESLEALILASPPSASVTADERAIIDATEAAGRLHRWQGIEAFLDEYEPPVRVEAERLWVLPRRASPPSPLVLHLLNRDYEEAQDRFVPKQDSVIRVRADWARLDDEPTARLVAPGASDLVLEVRSEGDWLAVTVPSVAYWGVLALR